jgi:hypothetical protein
MTHVSSQGEYRLARQHDPVVTEERDKRSLRELSMISGMRPKPCLASLVSENAGNSRVD